MKKRYILILVFLLIIITYLILNPTWIIKPKYMIDSRYCEQDNDCVPQGDSCSIVNIYNYKESYVVCDINIPGAKCFENKCVGLYYEGN